MTVVDFSRRYVKWCNDNGVFAIPKGSSTDGWEIMGYEREPLLVWTDEDREPLRQSVKLLQMAETPIAGLEEVQRYFSVPVAVKVPWNAPVVVDLPLPASPVGKPIPGSPDRFQHLGNEPLGTVRIDSTGEYVVEGHELFARWWKKVK